MAGMESAVCESQLSVCVCATDTHTHTLGWVNANLPTDNSEQGLTHNSQTPDTLDET